jgi:hypothetical protein
MGMYSGRPGHVTITRRRMLAAAGGLAAMAARRHAAADAPISAVSKRRSQTMEIKRNGSQPARKGPAENFTGSVRIDPLFEAQEPSRVSGGSVSFEPGAQRLAHASARPDLDRDIRPRLDAVLGRTKGRNPAR